MNLSTDTIAGYQLLDRLSDRSTRAVFHAKTPSGTPVMVKVADPGATGGGSLQEEGAKLVELQGSAVAPAIVFGKDPLTGLDYLVLEPGGTSLADQLANRTEQRLSPMEAMETVLAIAEAVQTLHDRDWIHGDLKPSNVLLSPEGKVTLIDLECSRSLPAPSGSSAMVPGTPPFLPPEVLTQGEMALSKATDVWALGIIFYMTIVGEYPFGTGSHAELAARFQTNPPLPEGDVPPAIHALLKEKLLTFDPQQRVEDAGKVAAWLRGSMEDLEWESERIAPAAAAPLEEETAPRYDLEIATVASADMVDASAMPTPELPAKSAASPAPKARKRSASAFDLETVRPPSPVVGGIEEDEGSGAPGAVTLERSTAARWFRQMNPHRSFELSVFFAAGKIHVVPGKNQGVHVSQAKLEIDASEPDVEVEPHFPGCLVTPARMRVDLSPEVVTSKFWITPLAQGDLKAACVRVSYRGKLVDTLSTPSRVVSRTSAKVTAMVGMGWPLIYPILEQRGWSWSEQVRQDFPLLRTVVDLLGTGLGTVILMGIILVVAAILFRLSRPLPCEDVLPVVVMPKR